MQQGHGNIISISNKCYIQTFERTKFFNYRKRIRHRLAWMIVIAQAIDYRDGRPFGKFEHMSVIKNACHDGIHVTRNNSGDVCNRFPLTETDFSWGKVKGIPSHVAHGHVETHSGAQAGLLKDHSENFAFENGLVAACEVLFLQVNCQIKHFLKLCW
jgi:hypothetical protein